jgi:hypothetical protein
MYCILSLLITSILVSKNIIWRTQAQKVIMEYEFIQSNIAIFFDKFEQLPGNLTTETSLIVKADILNFLFIKI